MTNNSALPEPDHLAAWKGRSWGLWRWFLLRSAGFPGREVLRLADRECSSAADRLLDVEETAEKRRQAALGDVRRKLKDVRGEVPAKTAEYRKGLHKLLRKLKKRRLSPAEPGLTPAIPAVEAYREAAVQEEEARTSYGEAFAAVELRLTREIGSLARDDRFREAILWQNRTSVKHTVDTLAQGTHGSERHHRHRRREQFLASYLQRYSVKNDTIGFFGPMAWAEILPDGPPVTVRAGDGLLARRQLVFELWAVDAVARALVRDHPDLRPWLAPWRLPFFHLDGDFYSALGGPSRNLSRAERTVFEACDGVRPAVEIARRALQDPALSGASTDEVYRVLEHLTEEKKIGWTLQVPPRVDAMALVRRQLEAVGETGLRERVLARFRAVEEAADAAARAGGRSAAVDSALARLESRFAELTGRKAQRFGGRLYAGRTLVYEECLRDVELRAGPRIFRQLEAPLELFLASGRWLTWEMARRFRRSLRSCYETYRREHGVAEISLFDFHPHIRSSMLALYQDPEHVREFQRRWARLLPLPADRRRRLRFSSAELRPGVLEAFDAPAPGWKSARHHSVDLLVAAASVDACQRGEHQLILGEFHAAWHALHSGAVRLHPERETLLTALDRDLPEPAVVFSMAKMEEEPQGPNPFEVGAYPLRVDMRPVRPRDFVIQMTADPPHGLGRTIPVGDLVVAEIHGEVVIRTRDGRRVFALLDFFDVALTDLVVHQFDLFSPRPHLPRILIDDLVLQRETWRVPAGEIPRGERSEAERFLALRRWARGLGLPRWIFVKSPIEGKPLFLDFESPHSLVLLARLAGEAEKTAPEANITISEMLPDVEHLWLPDASGRRYASEWRLTLVDRRVIGAHERARPL